MKLPCKLQANDLVIGQKHQLNILNDQMFIIQPSETIFCSARNTCVFMPVYGIADYIGFHDTYRAFQMES